MAASTVTSAAVALPAAAPEGGGGTVSVTAAAAVGEEVGHLAIMRVTVSNMGLFVHGAEQLSVLMAVMAAHRERSATARMTPCMPRGGMPPPNAKNGVSSCSSHDLRHCTESNDLAHVSMSDFAATDFPLPI